MRVHDDCLAGAVDHHQAATDARNFAASNDPRILVENFEISRFKTVFGKRLDLRFVFIVVLFHKLILKVSEFGRQSH